MRLLTVFISTALVFASALASTVTVDLNLQTVVGVDLTKENFYGAPKAPWVPGALPGWYYGDNPDLQKELTFLFGIICKILKFFPDALQCPVKPPSVPPPSDGYHQTFSNLTGATQASDYLTFGLVDTVADCKAMCNAVNGCEFINAYHDVNGKDGSPQLTCALFSQCHTSDDADNVGGQTQPDGSVDFITNSDGFCKDST